MRTAITLLTVGTLFLGQNIFDVTKAEFTDTCSGEVKVKKRGRVLLCEEEDRVIGAYFPSDDATATALTVVKK